MTEATLSEAVATSLDKMVCERIGELLDEAIGEWEVQHVIREVLTPVTKKILEEELAKPELQDMLREAVVNAMKRSLPNLKIGIENRGY